MRTLLTLLACLLFAAPAIAVSPDRVKEFSIPGTDGQDVSLSTDADVRFHVLCFLGTECPLAKLYGPRLQRLSQQYRDQGVRFLGINSNVQDSMEQWADYGKKFEITFPLGKDFDRSVAMAAGATRTPEVIVIDRGGKVCYRGRIDDQYQPGIARQAPSQHDLRDAIEQLIAGQSVATPRTDAVGCLIAMPRTNAAVKSDVTYCKEIARVLQRNCIECHRAGEIGPFSLEDYNEIVGWSDMMLEVVDEQRMPPWHASDQHAKFANARRMTDRDKQLLREWVDSGMAYGNQSDLPQPIARTKGWRLEREPDLVLPISKRAFRVPAEGTVEYQYFVVDPKFTQDKWVSAAQIIPGNHSVVHHVIAFIRPPDGSSIRSFGMLSAYVPGQIISPLPAGYARKVPAGSRIVFQMHYTPTGSEADDLTHIGLLFADAKEVTHEVFAMGAIEQEFEIPPGEANHQVNGTLQGFPKDGRLLSIMPHMHLRGKAFRLSQKSRDKTETLLDVPHYDFNWQHNYELADPLDLSAVDELQFTAVFDNSDRNPTNPDPSEYVTWGDQTWQEMAVMFVAVAKPLRPENGSGIDRVGVSDKESSVPTEQEEAEYKAALERASEFAGDYLKRFDKNGDEQLAKHELPDSVRMFVFGSMDHNRDDVVTRQEIADHALWRLPR